MSHKNAIKLKIRGATCDFALYPPLPPLRTKSYHSPLILTLGHVCVHCTLTYLFERKKFQPEFPVKMEFDHPSAFDIDVFAYMEFLFDNLIRRQRQIDMKKKK